MGDDSVGRFAVGSNGDRFFDAIGTDREQSLACPTRRYWLGLGVFGLHVYTRQNQSGRSGNTCTNDGGARVGKARSRLNGGPKLNEAVEGIQKAIEATDRDSLDLGLFFGGRGGGVDSLGGRATLNVNDTFGAFVEGSKNINTADWQAVTGIKVRW